MTGTMDFPAPPPPYDGPAWQECYCGAPVYRYPNGRKVNPGNPWKPETPHHCAWYGPHPRPAPPPSDPEGF